MESDAMTNTSVNDRMHIIMEMDIIPDDWARHSPSQNSLGKNSIYSNDPLYLIRYCVDNDFRGSMSIGRNDPCYCGSGKKFKRCHWRQTKPFIHSYAGHSEKFNAVALASDGTPMVRILSGEWTRADAAFFKTGYSGLNGKEVITNLIDSTFIHPINEVEFLRHLGFYDLIVVIDTNTDFIDGVPVSVVVVKQLKFTPLSNVDVLSSGPKAWQVSIFKGLPKGEAEKFGWISFVRHLEKDPNYNAVMRIAIVTDHDYGNHGAYNAKKKSVHGDVYLPDNVSLVYAKGDKKTDTHLNRILTGCDKVAGAILNQLKRNGCAFTHNAVFELHPNCSDQYIVKKLEEPSSAFARSGVITSSIIQTAHWGEL